MASWTFKAIPRTVVARGVGMGLLLLHGNAMTEKNVPKKADVRLDITSLKAYADGFLSAQRNEKEWESAKVAFQAFLDNRLRENGANVGTVDGKDAWRLTEYARDKTDWAKLKEQYPELVERFTTQVDAKRSGPVKDKG